MVAELPTDSGLDWSEAILMSEDRSIALVVDGKPFWIATTDGTAKHIVYTIRSALDNLD